MLEIWMQHSEASRIAAVLRFAGRLLLRQQTTPNWDDAQTTMQIATALLPDAWALYSKTLNLFGRGMLDAPVLYGPRVTILPTLRSSKRVA